MEHPLSVPCWVTNLSDATEAKLADFFSILLGLFSARFIADTKVSAGCAPEIAMLPFTTK